MWAYIQSFFGNQQEPKPVPTPVTIVAARFPADGTLPHLLQLKTTSSLDIPCFSIDGHVPDLTAFWNIPNPWAYADRTRLEVTQQSTNWICEGVYVIYFTDAIDQLPENPNFPEEILGDRFLYGDIFVVKLQTREFGERGWALYDDVPEKFLGLPVMRGRRTLRADIQYLLR